MLDSIRALFTRKTHGYSPGIKVVEADSSSVSVGPSGMKSAFLRTDGPVQVPVMVGHRCPPAWKFWRWRERADWKAGRIKSVEDVFGRPEDPVVRCGRSLDVARDNPFIVRNKPLAKMLARMVDEAMVSEYKFIELDPGMADFMRRHLDERQIRYSESRENEIVTFDLKANQDPTDEPNEYEYVVFKCSGCGSKVKADESFKAGWVVDEAGSAFCPGCQVARREDAEAKQRLSTDQK